MSARSLYDGNGVPNNANSMSASDTITWTATGDVYPAAGIDFESVKLSDGRTQVTISVGEISSTADAYAGTVLTASLPSAYAPSPSVRRVIGSTSIEQTVGAQHAFAEVNGTLLKLTVPNNLTTAQAKTVLGFTGTYYL